jgi:hypothetical protein
MLTKANFLVWNELQFNTNDTYESYVFRREIRDLALCHGHVRFFFLIFVWILIASYKMSIERKSKDK